MRVSNATQTAVVFPGQGSQTSSMEEVVRLGRPDLFELVCDLVGENPFTRVSESTRFAQPAIFTTSLAEWSQLRITPVAAAGHSLGEFAALVAAGVLDERTALELVVLRGQLMAESDLDGKMLAVVGVGLEAVEAVAQAAGVVIANDNAPKQLVLSGPPDRIETAARMANDRGWRALRLDVAGAFHSPSMLSAVDPFRQALAAVTFNPPQFKIFSCTSAEPFQDFAAELSAALVAPVRWRETVLAIARLGVSDFLEVGPGSVLERLIQKILPQPDQLLNRAAIV